MNIFYITDERLDDRSVETIHISEVCKNLFLLGHHVVLYAPAAVYFSKQSYATVLLGAPRPAFSLRFQLSLFFRVWRDIRLHRPDIIYARHNHLLIVPALLSRFFGVPLMLEVNGLPVAEARHTDNSFLGRSLLALGIFSALESISMRSATRLIVVTKGIKDFLIKQYRLSSGQISVIPNGVDAEFFAPMPQAAARATLGLDPHAIYVGYIGSFYTWQGLREVIQAARLVLEKRPHTKFLFVGQGDEEAYLRAFVREHSLEQSIAILPAVSHALVPAYLNALDVCVCYPTMFRAGMTSPFKVYEYLACGKPVVLADIRGMREEFGAVLHYAKPESPKALAEVLVPIIDDPHVRKDLGKQARAFIERGRSWRVIAQELEAVCTAALG